VKAGEGCGDAKSKGCPQKTSGRSYSLEHPVARHFVCSYIKQIACRSQLLQNKSLRIGGSVGIARQGERITAVGSTQKLGQSGLLKRSGAKIFVSAAFIARARFLPCFIWTFLFEDGFACYWTAKEINPVFIRELHFVRYNRTEFFPPIKPAPLAQLDRASGYEPEGREFESLRAHHLSVQFSVVVDPSQTPLRISAGDSRSPLRVFAHAANTPQVRISQGAPSLGTVSY
jgi:hypothetical protein